MKILASISNGLSFVERTLLVLILSVMVGLAFLQVVLRNFFNSGLLWADPLLRHAVLWIAFLGASLAARQEKHINIDLVARYLSPKLSDGARVVTNLFAAIVCGLLCNAGWTFVSNEQATGEILLTIGAREFPAWWFQLIIPLGFGLMAFRFLLKSIEHLAAALRPSLPGSQNEPSSGA